eukprot:gene33705-43563_t
MSTEESTFSQLQSWRQSEGEWDLYVNTLAKTTCKAEQRRLLAKGPPSKIHDDKALPVPENAQVELLWYSSDSLEHSSKLLGALEGEARTKYWEDQKLFYIHDEAEDAVEEKS